MSTLLYLLSMVNIGFAFMDISHGDIFRVLFDIICAFALWNSAYSKTAWEAEE